MTTRKIFTALEQLKRQYEELRAQQNNQTALLQLLVGKFGGVEKATFQLPDSISLPCTTLQDLQQLDSQMSDRAVRTNVVCIGVICTQLFHEAET